MQAAPPALSSIAAGVRRILQQEGCCHGVHQVGVDVHGAACTDVRSSLQCNGLSLLFTVHAGSCLMATASTASRRQQR